MTRLALVTLVSLLAASSSHAALIGYWNFDAGSGQTVADNSGNGNSGFLGTSAGADGGDPSWSTSGQFGGAVDLAAGNRVTIPTGHTLLPTTSLSQVGWVNLDSFTGVWGSAIQYPFTPGSHTNPFFENGIYIQNTGGLHTRIDGTQASPVFGTAVTAGSNNWHMVAVTWDGATGRAYVDGQEVGNFAAPTPIAYDNVSPVLFGVNAGGGETLDGRLDDFAMYDNAVSAEGIALINGLGRFAGITQTDSAIASGEAVFGATSGTFKAGKQIWAYGTSLGAGTVGLTGGSVGALDAFIVLDGAGNGVQLVGLIPEPSTALLLGLGLLGLVSRRRRK
ncbi:MAG: LamG domain-containing protein [Planctomycetales bacterium]|nr:LamG domain-containing protein [Planctomycetales bacterium]